MKSVTKSKTPTKTNNNQKSDEQPIVIIHQNSMKILFNEKPQQITKYLLQNKITSFTMKNEKSLYILNTTIKIFKGMVLQNQNYDQFLNRIINHFKKNGKKVYDFLRCLRHFAERDYQFQYIEAVAKAKKQEAISFYLKIRTSIIDSFLNKTKRQLLVNVIGDQEQWFKIVKKIYKNIPQQNIIQIYTETLKYHYLNIKKNQNQHLNGSQIFRICQIINRNLNGQQIPQIKFNSQNSQTNQNNYNHNNSINEDGSQNISNKQKQVKRLFDKNILDGLQAQDRQLIRILSYKDDNIARLLQKKHQTMIELIAEDVQKMRRSIEGQKKKYKELWQQKQQAAKTGDLLNYLILNYMSNDTIENQQKLLKNIQNFNKKFKQNSQTTQMIKQMRQSKKNKRLIQLIQKQQRQKC